MPVQRMLAIWLGALLVVGGGGPLRAVANAATAPGQEAARNPGQNVGQDVGQDAAKALATGSPGQSVGLFTQALGAPDLTREARALLLNDRGLAYMQLPDPKAALTDFNTAVKLYPEFAAIYNNRGGLLLNLGLVADAIKDFDRAILLAPKYGAAVNNRAASYARLKDRSRAMRDYALANELLPSSPAPLIGRSVEHLKARRPFAAVRDLGRGIVLAPRLAALYELRAEGRERIGRVSGAIEDLNQIVALLPEQPSGYLRRGRLLLRSGDTSGALRDLEKAVELDASNADAFAWRGAAYGRARAYDKALEDFDRAFALVPQHAVAFAERSKVARRQGDDIRALGDARAALRLDKTNKTALRVRAETLEGLGRVEEAVPAYQVWLRAEPGSKRAYSGLRRLGGDGDTRAIVRPGKRVAGAGIDEWQVLEDHTARGGAAAYFAWNARHPRLRVPLEAFGGGRPKLLEWERKTRPFRGIGLLRFAAGTVFRQGKQVSLEQTAIVDLSQGVVHGLEPYRVGRAHSTWTWDNGSVTVLAPDGVTNVFKLRRVARPRPVAAYRSTPGWAGGLWGFDTQGPKARRQRGQRRSSRRRKRRKPKSLFQLLFQ